MGLMEVKTSAAEPARPPVFLFVLPWSLEHVGGVNQVVVNLAREMARQGHYEPVVLIVDWEADSPIWGTSHGICTVRWKIRPPASDGGVRQRLGYAAWRWRFAPAFKAFCRQRKVAVINFHNPTEVALTVQDLLDRDPALPRLMLSVHGADLTGIEAGAPALLAQWRALARRALAVVACSAALGQRARTVLAREPAVIHNGIDAGSFRSLAGSPATQARRSILTVGKFEAKKGQDVLVTAFATLAHDHADLDLVLVGATDTALPRLRQLCTDLGLQDRVRFHPDVPHTEVAAHMAAASLFVLPSRQEPFGIVLLEAGALALPVVASAVGGIPEILEEGVTARLVVPDAPGELAQALRALLDEPAAARAMGRRLQSHVNRHFSWTQAHDRYVQLLEQAPRSEADAPEGTVYPTS